MKRETDGEKKSDHDVPLIVTRTTDYRNNLWRMFRVNIKKYTFFLMVM